MCSALSTLRYLLTNTLFLGCDSVAKQYKKLHSELQFTEVPIPGASSTKPAARILIIPNRHTRTHTWAHLSLQPPQARRYQLFFAILVLVFTAEYSLRFLLLCFCLGGVLRHPRIHHKPRSSSLAHARAPLRIKTKTAIACRLLLRTTQIKNGSRLLGRAFKCRSTRLAFHRHEKKNEKRKHFTHARLQRSTNPDSSDGTVSRVSGDHCRVRVPHRLAKKKSSNTRSEMENGTHNSPDPTSRLTHSFSRAGRAPAPRARRKRRKQTRRSTPPPLIAEKLREVPYARGSPGC